MIEPTERAGAPRRRSAGWILGACCALALSAVAGAPASAATSYGTSWSSGGQNIANSRSNPAETAISPSNAATLGTKWTFTTHGDVSATPAVVNGAVYFPDWGGYLNKVDANTGQAIWSNKVGDYLGDPSSSSRTSPAVDHGTVYIGAHDQQGAQVIAIDAATGKPRWTKQLDAHPAALVTQSPLVYGGVVYVGVSSLEELFATNPAYACCTFRGSMTALDAKTGAVLWRTYTVPDNGGQAGGYSGGAVWGGTAALDPTTNTLYIDTGNNYEVPAAVKACQEQHPDDPPACLDPNDHIDSVLALDARTGKVKWASGDRVFDDWNLACAPSLFGGSPDNCPLDPGNDADFGAGPNLMRVRMPDGKTRTVVGAGQKSGQYWLLDATTGTVLWSTAVGPGGDLGGILWGTATDGKRIYVAETNSENLGYTLPDGTSTTGSSFAALDAATGKVLWQVADPSGGSDMGAVSVANDVVYAGSMSGHMYALDARTGKILRDLQGQGSSNAGPAIANGTVYWGNGYTHLPLAGATGSTTFYAFAPKLGTTPTKPTYPPAVADTAVGRLRAGPPRATGRGWSARESPRPAFRRASVDLASDAGTQRRR